MPFQTLSADESGCSIVYGTQNLLGEKKVCLRGRLVAENAFSKPSLLSSKSPCRVVGPIPPVAIIRIVTGWHLDHYCQFTNRVPFSVVINRFHAFGALRVSLACAQIGFFGKVIDEDVDPVVAVPLRDDGIQRDLTPIAPADERHLIIAAAAFNGGPGLNNNRANYDGDQDNGKWANHTSHLKDIARSASSIMKL